MALALALVLLALATPALAEGPTTGTCDASGRIVCAGADAGASVSCTLTGATASCSWTRGHVWKAWSPLGLPGEAAMRATGTLVACVASACTTTTAPTGPHACAWAAVAACSGDALDAGAAGPVALALGQCFTVTSTMTITVDGAAGAAGLEVERVAWTSTGSDAGQVCRVDDGRGG